MSAAAIAGPLGSTDQVVLRWSDNSELPVREETVEILESCFPESIVRSSLQVSEETYVYLIGKDYTGNGIIQSCRSEGNEFILTILMTSDFPLPELSIKPDPGVFAIDEFLTEEEELKILESLRGGM